MSTSDQVRMKAFSLFPFFPLFSWLDGYSTLPQHISPNDIFEKDVLLDEDIEGGEFHQNKRPHLQRIDGIEREEISDDDEDGDDEEEEEEDMFV